MSWVKLIRYFFIILTQLIDNFLNSCSISTIKSVKYFSFDLFAISIFCPFDLLLSIYLIRSSVIESLQGISLTWKIFSVKISKGDKGKNFENYELASLWRKIVWAALLVCYLSFKFSYFGKNFRTNFKSFYF